MLRGLNDQNQIKSGSGTSARMHMVVCGISP
jgi:hypothetical protein